MAKLKVIEPPKGENKRYTGVLTVLQRLNKYEFAVEIKVMREGINRNGWDYRNLEDHYETFLGQPILCAFVNGKIGDGHNMREKVDRKTGEKYYSFTDATAERIVGALSADKEDFAIREIDGEKWLVAKGRLWEFYAPELVQKIIRTGRMDVSAETMVEDSYAERGIEVFTSWVGLGVTILGDDVEPAIPNASIKALQLLGGEFAEAKLKAASYEQRQAQESKDQKNTKTKQGDYKMTVLNFRELSALQKAHFPTYTVLSAIHDEEKGEKLICLMAEDGATFNYIMKDGESTVQPERINSVSVNASVAFDAERSVSVDLFTMNKTLTDRVASLSNENSNLTDRAEKAESALKAMQEAETARRRKTAKAAAKAALEKFNETAECEVDAKVLSDIDKDVDEGKYDDCVDCDNEWCGDEAACNAVYAEIGKAQQKIDAEKARKNSKVVVWKKDGVANNSDGGVKNILARIRNQQ